jgi:hypothetical protein
MRYDTYEDYVWHCGRMVWCRLTYAISEERGYRVSRLVGIEEIEAPVKAA